jgi:CRISPR-associated exonuclease Cas4
MTWLFVGLGLAALLLMLIGAGAIVNARRQRAASGVPWGDILFDDLEEESLDQPLLSRKYGLVGKPDLLLRQKRGGEELLIPVEVKSARQPSRAHEGHLLQLGAYLLLVEENYATPPTFGILRYADGESLVAWTEELRGEVLAAADAIRAARTATDVPRSHDDPARCRNCGYSHACDEALAS